MLIPKIWTFKRSEGVRSRLFPFHDRQVAGATRGLFEMRTPDQYREFAAECYRLAAEAKTEAQEKILREMALAWSEVAKAVETGRQS